VYDEEGTVYLRYAWDCGFWRSLIAPHQGYYSLFANLCGALAARVLPLAQAGHFFYWAEIAIEMLLVYMVVQCEALPGWKEKAVAVAVVLLSPPTSDVAMGTIHAQFYLAVMTAVILVSSAERLEWVRIGALALAGLTGVTSCALLPLFIVQAWRERSAGRVAQTVMLAACTIAQVPALLPQAQIFYGPHSAFHFYSGAIVANGMLAHFFTHWSYVESCKAIGSPKLYDLQTWLWVGLELASGLYIAAVVVLAWRGGRAAKLLVLAALLSLAVSFRRNGALNDDLMCGSGGRYFFIFNLLVGLSLVLVWQSGLRLRSVVSCALLICCLVSGALDLRRNDQWPRLVWSQQVAYWEADPDYKLRIRPSGWPELKLASEPGNKKLAANVYDTTTPGWEDR
jgi:hypothetical protein